MNAARLITAHSTLLRTSKELENMVKISVGDRKAKLLLIRGQVLQTMATIEDTIYEAATT
jgi:hypothetical protein